MKSSLMKSLILTASLIFSQTLHAKLHLPSFISDGMVLQQKKPNRIWGWSDPRQHITVMFKGKPYQAFANSSGEWQLFLDPASAGNAGSMTVSTGTEKIEISNLLIGELWVCSGQSNMEWTMGMFADTYKEEINTASNDEIRYVVIKHAISNTPQQDAVLSRPWSAVTPGNTAHCSALAYWYAKQLYRQLEVPVGLIITSWGGTLAQSWTSYEGLHDFPEYSGTYRDIIQPLNLSDLEGLQQSARERNESNFRKKAAFVKEAIQLGYDDGSWKEMYLPKPWEAQGLPGLDGIVLYRIMFNVAESDAGKAAELNLPAIDDNDSTFINGTFIGTSIQWDALRTYTIPAGILTAGKNCLAIRVQDNGGGGGLSERIGEFNVSIGHENIPLEGRAKYNVVAVLEDMTGGHGAIEHQPAVLFNGMIAPLLPLTICGVIWYQGESNDGRPVEYRTLFPALINDWRYRWGLGDFPFLFVQLSSFGPIKAIPGESNWALLREAQAKALSLPNTAMAVTIDIGNPLDIHPDKKKEAGNRLAAAAMKLVYGKSKAVSSGPQLIHTEIKGHQVILRFSNADNGLMLKGSALQHIAIAGADQQFVWADAIIKGNVVTVSAKGVNHPVAVRYAWADSPVSANLYNKEGFPAAPFRTDDW